MEYRKIVISIILLHIIIFLGIFGYMIFEDLAFFDSLWLTIVSVLTIGYGDISPESTSGKLLTLVLIPSAIGLTTYMLAQLAGAILGGKLSSEVRKRRMSLKIQDLHQHIILCGYGRVGQQVFQQLRNENKPLVVIESDETVIAQLPENTLYVKGNATEDRVLLQAGVDRAKGMIVTLPDDADNVFITLTVKGMNPALYTVVRAEKDFSEEKLYRAGADKVINTSNIGGKRMATAITKPVSVEYVETILHDPLNDYNIEEIHIPKNSFLLDQTLKESDIRRIYGVNIVAIKRKDRIISNPEGDETFQENDLLIVFATSEQLKRFEKAAT
ncbi:potassium channel family protein [Halobacillus faecis]